MKQAENNEIDKLLRSLARRDHRAGARRQSAETSAHLDADELNAYAEGALPVSTRARYTAHLVDCDDCRTIVGQLSLAVSPLVRERISEQSAEVALTWGDKFRVLLSPRVLRYAMPAFVLVAIAIGFFAWRARQKEEALLVARDQRAERVSATKTEVDQPTSAPEGNGNGAVKTERKPLKPQPAATVAETKKAEGQSSAASGAGASSEEQRKDKAPSKSDSGAASQPAYAPEPPPPPASKPATSTVAKNQPAKAAKEQEAEARDARKNDYDKKIAGDFAKEKAPSARRAENRAKSNVASDAASAGRRAGDDESETRSVAGRHFRRQSGAWVDTEYVSSRSTINVARGSEQYRALVADEPAIGAIAQQLSGEVIVVWKSRAYRIH
jgi:hypothetical protein